MRLRPRVLDYDSPKLGLRCWPSPQTDACHAARSSRSIAMRLESKRRARLTSSFVLDWGAASYSATERRRRRNGATRKYIRPTVGDAELPEAGRVSLRNRVLVLSTGLAQNLP